MLWSLQGTRMMQKVHWTEQFVSWVLFWLLQNLVLTPTLIYKQTRKGYSRKKFTFERQEEMVGVYCLTDTSFDASSQKWWLYSGWKGNELLDALGLTCPFPATSTEARPLRSSVSDRIPVPLSWHHCQSKHFQQEHIQTHPEFPEFRERMYVTVFITCILK